MTGLVTCYCPRCKRDTPHEIYISKGGYLHSLCVRCGKDVCSSAKVREICTRMVTTCSREGGSRLHIKYISKGGYLHWFCCSCGRDISSSAQVSSC